MESNIPKNIPEDLGPVANYSRQKIAPPPPEDLTDVIETASDDTEPDAPQYKVESEVLSRRPKRRSIITNLLVLTALALALIWVCREIHGSLQDAFQVHWVYGFTSAFFVLLLVVLVSVVMIREIRGYLRLASFEGLRNCIEELEVRPRDSHINTHVRSEFQRLLQHLEKVADGSIRSGIPEVKKRMDLAEDAHEWKKHVEQVLLEPLDKEVSRKIREEAIYVAVGTALSPKGFMDALISLWRNITLVKEIAKIYQVRAGTYGTLVLIKRSIVSAATAILAEEAATVLVTNIGGRLLRFLSPLAQGATNGAMTIRVGIEAQKLCRPIPLPEHKEHGLLSTGLSAIGQALQKLRKKEAKQDEKDSGFKQNNA